MQCKRCGAQLPADALFCTNCGERIDAADEPRQTYYAPQTGANGVYNPPQSDGNGVYSPPRPDMNAPQSSGSARRKSGVGGAVFGRIVRIVIGLVVIALVALGMNLFHQHSSFLSKGETIDLDAILAQGDDFPVGEFVRVEASFVLDVFASENNTINGITSGEDFYYCIILKNNHAIAVKAASKDDIALLDKATQDSVAYLNDELDYFDDIPLEGKLVKLTGTELKGYFDEMTEGYGFNDADSRISPQYYMIDMTAARTGNVLLYIVAPIAGVVLIAVVVVLVLRKRKAVKAEIAE